MGGKKAVAAATARWAMIRYRRWRGRLGARALGAGVLVLVAVALTAGGFAVLGRAQPARVDLALGAPSVFYTVPEMVTALDSGGAARQRYVRLALVLEVAATDADRLEAGEPVILDAVQQHLRALRPADLAGRAGTQLLRQAVREIVDQRVRPSELRGVLFTQLLVD